MTIGSVNATLTAENTFTDWMATKGKFNVSITGINGDTVTVQRSIDGGTTILDVKDYTANKQESGEEIEHGWSYRIGIKTGNYSAGTVIVWLSF